MNTAIIQPLDKGQITIPAAIRQELGIGKDTILKLVVRGRELVIKPLTLDWKEKYIRTYSDSELKEFYELDKLDGKTRAKLNKILGLA